MRPRAGFTLTEVLVSLVLLGVVFGSLAGVAGRYAHNVATTGVRSAAIQMASDRIEQVRMHPRYGEIDLLFSGTEFDVRGIDGAVRETRVARQVDSLSSGVVDYTVVTVEVSRPGLLHPVARTTIVGAP